MALERRISRLGCTACFAQLVVFFIVCSSATALDADSQECVALNRSVSIPVQVRLLFAGTPPVFMREASWNLQAKRGFLRDLANTVRFKAMPIEDDTLPVPAVFGKPHPNACSIVEYSYTYETAFAHKNTIEALDRALSSLLKESKSMFADSEKAADEFFKVLSEERNFRDSKDPLVYNLLVYNAMSLAPQYGYRAEDGAPVRTVGVASGKRFAFVDVGARPFFLFNSGSLTPGEVLMSLSHSPAKYAAEMHSIAAQLITPPVSEKMRRFPQETTLAFQLNLVDVSAVIGRRSGVGGDSLRNKPIGSTFSPGNFTGLLHTVLSDPVVKEKKLSISVATANMSEDATMAMAVSRAFSTKGLEMVLDSNRLLSDILSKRNSKTYGYFADASFVAHIPLYLFSFADDSRITHFETGEQVHAMVVGKQAVFMTENRLRDDGDVYSTVTSAATKEVLEMLFGLSSSPLAMMNSELSSVPLLLRDIARRNVLMQELDWSERTAAWKAVELLNFEGLDSRLIPHESGSAIAQSHKNVKQHLRKLQASWSSAATSLSVAGVESATLELREKNKGLADRLHEEICNQPLSEEILLKAEVELGSEEEVAVVSEGRRSYWVWLVLSAIAGISCGAVLHYRSDRRGRARGAYFDDISIPSTVRGLDVTSTQWFSTLTASDKPKVN